MNFIFILFIINLYSKILYSKFEFLKKFENEIYAKGYIKMYNKYIFLDYSVYEWFFVNKESICESFGYDSDFSQLEYYLDEKKEESVEITRVKPCCKMLI